MTSICEDKILLDNLIFDLQITKKHVEIPFDIHTEMIDKLTTCQRVYLKFYDLDDSNQKMYLGLLMMTKYGRIIFGIENCELFKTGRIKHAKHIITSSFGDYRRNEQIARMHIGEGCRYNIMSYLDEIIDFYEQDFSESDKWVIETLRIKKRRQNKITNLVTLYNNIFLERTDGLFGENLLPTKTKSVGDGVIDNYTSQTRSGKNRKKRKIRSSSRTSPILKKQKHEKQNSDTIMKNADNDLSDEHLKWIKDNYGDQLVKNMTTLEHTKRHIHKMNVFHTTQLMAVNKKLKMKLDDNQKLHIETKLDTDAKFEIMKQNHDNKCKEQNEKFKEQLRKHNCQIAKFKLDMENLQKKLKGDGKKPLG